MLTTMEGTRVAAMVAEVAARKWMRATKCSRAGTAIPSLLSLSASRSSSKRRALRTSPPAAATARSAPHTAYACAGACQTWLCERPVFLNFCVYY